jgi:hypothetical protein
VATGGTAKAEAEVHAMVFGFFCGFFPAFFFFRDRAGVEASASAGLEREAFVLLFFAEGVCYAQQKGRRDLCVYICEAGGE